MSWKQLLLASYGVLAGVGYIASVIHRAWRKAGGRGELRLTLPVRGQGESRSRRPVS